MTQCTATFGRIHAEIYVPVQIICMDRAETYEQSCVNMIRTARKYKPEIVEG